MADSPPSLPDWACPHRSLPEEHPIGSWALLAQPAQRMWGSSADIQMRGRGFPPPRVAGRDVSGSRAGRGGPGGVPENGPVLEVGFAVPSTIGVFVRRGEAQAAPWPP